MDEMTPSERAIDLSDTLILDVEKTNDLLVAARWLINNAEKHIRAAVQAERAKRLQLAVLARVVMTYLEEDGPQIVPHLVDTDDNYGQFLRDAIEDILGDDVQSEIETAMMRPDNFTVARAAKLEAAIRARKQDPA